MNVHTFIHILINSFKFKKNNDLLLYSKYVTFKKVNDSKNAMLGIFKDINKTML